MRALQDSPEHSGMPVESSSTAVAFLPLRCTAAEFGRGEMAGDGSVLRRRKCEPTRPGLPGVQFDGKQGKQYLRRFQMLGARDPQNCCPHSSTTSFGLQLVSRGQCVPCVIVLEHSR